MLIAVVLTTIGFLEAYQVSRGEASAFDVGDSHTVALDAEGTLWAWGLNDHGQLGNGSTETSEKPQKLGEKGEWADVAAGGRFTMALKKDGSLWAWGDNGNGQLGDDTTSDRDVPVRIGEATDWEAIEAGGVSSYAVKADQSLWAWGWINQETTPTRIGQDRDWATVSGGGLFMMAGSTDGAVWGMGESTSGQLGNGDPFAGRRQTVPPRARGAWSRLRADSSQTESVSPAGVFDGLARSRLKGEWIGFECGFDHTLLVRPNGTLWGWGSNRGLQLTEMPDRLTVRYPMRLHDKSDWAQAAAGHTYSLALKDDGTLWGWGQNEAGQLGNGTTERAGSPVRIGENSDWVAVLAGVAAEHSLGLKEDGSLWAWGLNEDGQVGDGTRNNRLSPVRVMELGEVGPFEHDHEPGPPPKLGVAEKLEATVLFGQTVEWQLPIVNNGEGDLHFDLEVDARNRITLGSLEGSLVAGESTEISIELETEGVEAGIKAFEDLEAGTHSFALTLYSNDPDRWKLEVELSVTVVPRPIRLDPEVVRVDILKSFNGEPLYERTISVNPANPPEREVSWAIEEAPSWIAVTPTNGSGPSEMLLTIDPEELPEGNTHSGTIEISVESFTLELPIDVAVKPLELTTMITDYQRPYILCLHASEGDSRIGSLLGLNTETGQIDRKLYLGGHPTDIDIDSSGDRAYVILRADDSIVEVDLERFRVTERREFPEPDNKNGGKAHYHVESGGDGTLYYVDSAWQPLVHVFDFESGQEVSSFGFGGVGDIAVTRDGSTMFAWRQSGWRAGVLTSWESKIDAGTTELEVIETSFQSPRRDPIDAPILLSADESRIISKQHAFASDDLGEPLQTYDEVVYAETYYGDVVFGKTSAFDGESGELLYTFDSPSHVMAVSGDQTKLFRFDALAGELVSVPLSEIQEVPAFAERPLSFDQWRAKQFSESDAGDPAISGASADPDADGLSNVLEYAFGLDPGQTDSKGPWSGAIKRNEDDGLDYFHLTYQRRQAPDIDVRLQVSEDLIHWTDGEDGFEVVECTPHDDGSETVELRDRVPLQERRRRMLRWVIRWDT